MDAKERRVMLHPAYFIDPPPPEDEDEADRLYEQTRDAGPDGDPTPSPPDRAVEEEADDG